MEGNRHFDEEVIKMLDKSEYPKAETITESIEVVPAEKSIYTGVNLGGQFIEFEERPFFNGKVTMMIPKDFTDMELDKAKIKYPMENRAEIILTDYTTSINILFTHMDTPLNGETVANIRNKLFLMMQRVNPGIKMQSNGDELVNGNDVAYVEFTNPAVDGKVYNLMFYVELNQKPLMVVFNCLTKSAKYWKNSALEMMRSIKVVKGE
jgi:hypothetical protein